MDDVSNIYKRILFQALQAPGARVDRSDFLEKHLSMYCPDEMVELAIATSVQNAGISDEVLEKVAENAIQTQTYEVTGVSTVSGLPGGFAMLATIPADLVQFYYHVFVLAQKLAFLYDYEEFESDEELAYHLTLFIGVMYDVKGAKKAVATNPGNLAARTVSEVPDEVLAEIAEYLLKKNLTRWVGLKIAKKIFSKSYKTIKPMISGVVAGGIAYTTFKPMGYKLKDALEEGHKIQM